MYIFPAIDLYEGKAVRLLRGEYDKMTVYSNNPIEIAYEFEAQGASHIHMVDLEGAKNGGTPNLAIVKEVAQKTGLFVEIGGGIRSMDVIDTYINAGIDRVILGTAAVQDKSFVKNAVDKYGEKIAVGVDAKDNKVALEGWLESTDMDYIEFSRQLEKIGVKTVIYTDISKDGTLEGANIEGLKALSKAVNMDIVASGGVKDLEDLLKINELNLYGAISGKAIYSGSLDLKEALDALKG